MAALPDWMVLPPEGLSATAYEALPEDVCRRIEIVDGAIVVTAAPGRAHRMTARRLANALEDACGEHYAVTTDVDLRLRDVPLLNRRPDIVVFDASLPEDEVLRPLHCLLVVEVMSPGSITADQKDKPAEYAAAGIEHYWRIEGGEADTHKLTVFRYRLDPTTGIYAVAGADTGTMAISDPFDLTVDLADLMW
jgi:Uma2 family endonuclease